jgi:hypothetical protein
VQVLDGGTDARTDLGVQHLGECRQFVNCDVGVFENAFNDLER